MKRILLVVLLLVIGGQSSDARIPPDWPFDKLVAKSDVVVIIEPIENRPTDDIFPGNRSAANFVATNTRFKVAATLKAPGEPPADLTVVHFGYPANAMVVNGARFVRFEIGLRQPAWLAFLKRREDGRFEPASGHYDSVMSFRELREPPRHRFTQ
jgi:hypothetical protein